MQFKFVPLAISAWITPSSAGNLRSLPYHSYDFWIALTKNELNHNKSLPLTPSPLLGLWSKISFLMRSSLVSGSKPSATFLLPPLTFLIFLSYSFSLELTTILYLSHYVYMLEDEDAWENVFLLSLSSAWHLIDPQILVEQMNNLDTSQDQRKSRYSEKQEQSLKFLILHFCPSCTL